MKIRKVAVSSSRNSIVIRESWRYQQIIVISLNGISYNNHILDKLVLARSEKQKAVIELPYQGKTVRQIAQFVQVSFGDLCFIIRRETGEDEEQIESECQRLHKP
jgi:hypothetical protein